MNAVFIIAKNTFREVIRDRILYSLVVFALLLVLLSLALGQLSFDENIRLSANFGFTGIHISAMALAVFIGSTLVAKEIEKQTILTLLARPISRAQFIMGKALGLMAVVNVVVLSLGLILSIFLFFLNFNFQFEFLIALLGILFEAAILLSVALFFGSFARPIMTVVFTVSVFLLGHWVESLGYFIKRSESEFFKITATAVQYLIPDLERMNWRSAPVYAVAVPLDEVAKAAGWTLGWIMFLVAATVLIFGGEILSDALFADWAPLDWIWFVYVGVMGACLGSFANVVIYRLPRGESVVRPRSRCGACGTPIAFRHNIPILSWFLLRGKCASCGARYSFRYPAVEMLMAALFAVAYLEMGWSWTLLESLIFIFSLVTVSFIDLDHMILPDTFTLSGIVIGLLGALLNPEREFLDSVYGVLLGGGFLWAIAYLYFVVRKREGMGGGDIKLLAWIGAVLGWKAIPFVILVASLLGSVVGIGMAVLALRRRDSENATESEATADDTEVASFAIPFGPFLALGALLYLLLDGAELARLYLEWHGLV